MCSIVRYDLAGQVPLTPGKAGLKVTLALVRQASACKLRMPGRLR